MNSIELSDGLFLLTGKNRRLAKMKSMSFGNYQKENVSILIDNNNNKMIKVIYFFK